MFVLNVDKLRAKASAAGDDGPAAIQRRTRIAARSIYRILGGHTQPDLISALRLAHAYNFDIRDVMDEVTETAATA